MSSGFARHIGCSTDELPLILRMRHIRNGRRVPHSIVVIVLLKFSYSSKVLGVCPKLQQEVRSGFVMFV